MNILSAPKSYDNSFDIVSRLFTLLGIRFTRKFLLSKIEGHPHHPSLLCISEVLDDYQVQNATIVTSIGQLCKIPTPFITQIKGAGRFKYMVTLVKLVTAENVVLFDLESNKWKPIPLLDFDKLWQNKIAMVLDGEDSEGEENYVYNRIQGLIEFILRVFILGILPLFLLVGTFNCYRSFGVSGFVLSVYPILFLFGLAFTGYLFWIECTEDSANLEKVCQSLKKVSCVAVLKSRIAKPLGISFSIWGSSYFLGCLISLIIFKPWDRELLFLLSWGSILSTAMIIFSIYYQAFSLKQWCLLCLYVQGVLFALLLVGLWNGWYNTDYIELRPLLTRIIALGGNLGASLAILCLLRYAYKMMTENKRIRFELKKLKFNSSSFEGQQNSQQSATRSVENIGILLGKHLAEHQVLKICDPYCIHCAQSHKVIRSLIELNSDFNVRIIFTASANEDDPRFFPVKHFMELYDYGDQDFLLSAMDYWYLSPRRNIEALIKEFPLPDPVPNQQSKIQKMNRWCQDMEIIKTPTIFYNGKMLPDLYDIGDLRYVFA